MDQLPKISSAFLNVTDACNLACRYCFVKQKPNDMSYKTAKFATDWLYRNWMDNNRQWSPNINYFGGEPLLCWDHIVRPLTEYIRKAYGNTYTLAITTNGILLDEDKLKFLKDQQVSMLLSIDGDAETQDSQRPFHGGGSSFRTLQPKLDLILSFFPSVGFRSTITAQSAHLTFHNFLFAAKQGFLSWFGMPNDFEEWDTAHIEILRREVRKLGDYFIVECRAGRRPTIFSSFERMFSAICNINEAIQTQVDRNIPRCVACNRCGLGGTHYAAIDTVGRVFSCQDMCSFGTEDSPFYLGSIFDGVDDGRRAALIKSYDTRRCHGKDCSQCRLSRICDGGCVANNYMANGDIRAVPEIHCEWYQMLLEEAIRVMGVLGTEQNPVFTKIWGEQNG